MEHVSLYRRFRPDTFEKIVRQEHVVRVLKNQIAQNAVGHAYLFCGPRGTGKTSVARIFVRAVNCEHPNDGSPCGECATCKALSEGTLDVNEIDAASNNGVNEMRDLREKVQYPPVTGRYKVYIIDEVHMLTDSAFNALLKTLEEPPAHVIFILATTEPHKIPATILSRCMRLDFKLIPEEDLEAHLRRILREIGKPYEEEAVAAIARAGAGSDRDMLSIAEMCIAYSDKLTYEGVTAALGTADFKSAAKLASALLRADLSSALAEVEKLLSEGKSAGILLRDILELLRQISVAKTCAGAEKLLALPKELFRTVKEIADAADGRAVLRAAEIFAKTEYELRFSSSPRIALETAVMRICMPAAECDVDALLVRVNELERRVAALTVGGVRPSAETKPADEPQSVPQPIAEEDYYEPPEPEFYEPVPPEEAFTESVQAAEETPAEQAVTEQTAVKQATAEKAVAEQAPAEHMTAEMAFGKFMRTLRKTSRNGVLFTMCSDLIASFEGEKLVLTTDSETIYRALHREDHTKTMAETLSSVGIDSFEVRKAQSRSDGAGGIEQIKRDFSGYPIEIK